MKAKVNKLEEKVGLKVFCKVIRINEILRLTAGYTIWDEKRSSDIREQLDILNINDKVAHVK
jgi:hypothetical protein